MKTKLFILTQLFISLAFSQTSIHTKLVVLSNAGTYNGLLELAVMSKGTNLTGANTMSGATIDINYDNTAFSYPYSSESTALWNTSLNSTDGITFAYVKSVTNNTAFIRILIAGPNVGDNGDGTPAGYDFITTYDILCRVKFKILNTAPEDVAFSIATGSYAISLFTSNQNYNYSGASSYPILTIPENISNVPLPVELASFTASSSGPSTGLKWSTATEVNNYGFDVEKRAVSSQLSAVNTWQKVGFVNGAGTSNVKHSYSYSDNITVSGTYAYRLKQIDNSGIFKYSQENQVTIEIPKVFTMSQNYPNPFNPTTNIDFTVAADGKATLKVYNTLGQEVAELYNGVAQAGRIIQSHFDASRLASGIYFSRLETDGKSLVKRMMFVK